MVEIVVGGHHGPSLPRDHRGTGTTTPHVRVPRQISYIWTMITALKLP